MAGPRQRAISNLISIKFSGFIYLIVHYTGSGGATGSGSETIGPVNAPVAFGRYGSYPHGGADDPSTQIQDVKAHDDAKDFFDNNDVSDSLFHSSHGIAHVVQGTDFWYFARVPVSYRRLEIPMEMSICFPTGVGSIETEFILIRNKPSTARADGSFTFQDLMDAGVPDLAPGEEPPRPALYYQEDAPNVSIVSRYRWNELIVKLRDDNPTLGNPFKDPPELTWLE